MKTEAGELIHLDFGFKTYEAMRESETEIVIFKMTKKNDDGLFFYMILTLPND